MNGYVGASLFFVLSEDMAETFSFLILYKNYSLKKIKTDEILKKKVDFIKENILNIYQDFDFK